MSDIENGIRMAVFFVGLFYMLRIPYLLVFAQDVPGLELNHNGYPERFLISRGTSTFWYHCLRHVGIAVTIAVICLGGLVASNPNL